MHSVYSLNRMWHEIKLSIKISNLLDTQGVLYIYIYCSKFFTEADVGNTTLTFDRNKTVFCFKRRLIANYVKRT